MPIDYTKYAVVRGFAPMSSREGGKFAEGELGKMIPVALEHMAKGYDGVMILFESNKTWRADKIKEVSEQPDFTEWIKAAGG